MDYTVTLTVNKNKTQSLVLGEKTYTFQTGEIILELLGISTSSIDDALTNLDQVLSSREGNSLQQYIDVCSRTFSAFGQTWLRDLFEVVPISQTIGFADEQFGRVAFTKQEQNEIFACLKASKDYKSNALDDNVLRRMGVIRYAGNSVAGWNYWLECLSGQINLDDPLQYKLIESALDEVTVIGREHCQLLRKSIVELQILQKELPSYLTIVEKGHSCQLPSNNIIKTALSNVSLVLDADAPDITTKTYRCSALTELAALDFYFLRGSKNQIKFCKLCGRRFLATSVRQRFCKRSNPEYDGRSCADVGPAILYHDSISADEVLKCYQKNYKSYHRWKSVAQQAIERDRDLSEEEAKAIKNEIGNMYNRWVATTQEVKEMWQNGSIKQDAAIEKLQLPSVPNRSPKYAAWCLDQRLKAGIVD